MTEKWILIVDDEESILSVLKSSLKKLGPEYQVVTAQDAYEAIAQIKQRNFNLVVTDYKMPDLNGLELLEIIHTINPETRVILMTAYGNSSLETEAQRLEAYRYLTKPLEIHVFREIVQEALADKEVTLNRPGLLIMTDDSYIQVNRILNKLQGDIGARCIFLTDAEGHFIARIGDMEKLHLEQIASLLGGSVATLLEAGRVIDGETDTVNLSYREGKRENLYVLNIGAQLLLIIVSEHGPYSSKLGTVWFYAQRTALELREKLKETDLFTSTQVLSENIGNEIGSELDKLLGEDPDPNAAAYKHPAEPARSAETKRPPADEALLFSFDEAVGLGLLPNSLVVNTPENID